MKKDKMKLVYSEPQTEVCNVGMEGFLCASVEFEVDEARTLYEEEVVI